MNATELNAFRFLLAIPMFALSTWSTMLAFGFVHSVFAGVPAIGFWQSALLILAGLLLVLPGRLNKMILEEAAK